MSAVRGTSTPRSSDVERRLPASRGTSGWRLRSRTTETCAIVKESIAPNEYIVARNSVSPGSTVSIATAEKTMIAT